MSDLPDFSLSLTPEMDGNRKINFFRFQSKKISPIVAAVPSRMIAKFISNRRGTVFCSLFAFLMLLSPARSLAADAAETDRETCRKNLNTLYSAIQAYRVDHKDLPGWLSDLVPKYLKDAN